MHEVIEAGTALHEEVEPTHDGKDTKGEDPNTDDGDNAGLLAVLEETEQTEEGGQDIYNENGTGELPRGKGRPEGAIGTGDKDEPVLGE